MLSLLLATSISASQMAALIGNDRVTATYPGFRRTPGDTTALAANGQTREGMTDSIVIRKIATLSRSQTASFDMSEARKLALSHAHLMGYTDELSRTVLGEESSSVCTHPAYGFVLKRQMRLHLYGGGDQEWAQADTYVLTLVGNDLWEAAYERTYGASVDREIPMLIKFTGNFCVQPNYRG